jgi:nitrogen fixation protein NifU and related proteins
MRGDLHYTANKSAISMLTRAMPAAFPITPAGQWSEVRLTFDTVLITLRIVDDIIQDVKFKCMGCAVAIACSSVLTEMVFSKHVDETYEISKQSVADALGRIPEYKMQCSNLAPEAIQMAIDNWRERQRSAEPSA